MSQVIARKREPPTEAEIETTRRRISEVRIKLLSKSAFFATLAMELKVKMIRSVGMLIDGETFSVNAIGTMGVTPEGLLLVAPDHVDSLDDDELMGSLVHEVLHPAFLLFQRIKDRDVWLSNVVHDFIINQIALDAGFKLHGNGLQDVRARGAAFEALYVFFREEYDLRLRDWRAGVPIDQQGCKQKRHRDPRASLAHEFVKQIVFKDDPSGGEGGGEGEGEGEGEGGGGGGQPNWTHPEYDPCIEQDRQKAMAPENSAQHRQMENRWRQSLAQAKQKAINSDGWGSLPAELKQMIDELIDPTIDWRSRLSRWIGENGNRDDYSYQRPSRRGGFGGLLMPSLRGILPTVAIMVDTSGSMWGKEIKEVMSELAPLIEDLKCTGLFITCDAAVHGVFEDPEDVFFLRDNLEGGGGSDFRPGFKKLEELDHKGPTIVATDGFITVPEVEPIGMDIMWLLPEGGEDEGYRRPAAWGDVLEVPFHD